FIKTNYSGSPETFKKVTSSCPVPVTILGGERISDDACLQRIKGAMDGGAAGGAFGRNTMTHPYPAKIVRAIRKIIHEGSSIEEAKKELE
ncbi:MAG: fructose-bisphosphate aldolase, partial [Candidatus Bathyarchaeia archaeon]